VTTVAAAGVSKGAGGAARGSFLGALLALAIWVPAAVAVATVVIRLSIGEGIPLKPYAVGLGFLLAMVVWTVAALVVRSRATPAGANGSSYAELTQRLVAARTALGTAGAPADEAMVAARQQAQDGQSELERVLGLTDEVRPSQDGVRWVSGSGYVDAWRRLHRIEEALLLVQSEPLVIAEAFEDAERLRGSSMHGADDLSATLRLAVRVLNAGADPYFGPPSTTAASTAGPDRTQARAVLAKVRQAINEYRDDRWDGIVRARNQLNRNAILTGLTAYALLIVALLRDASDVALASASVYYLVGAVVGLFSRLRADADSSSAVEDYGLSTVRLVATPLISGLAAVGGVVLTVLLVSPSVGGALAPHTAAASSGDMPALANIFDVVGYPVGLVIAAIFGLTPGLAVSQLQREADRYQQDLQRSEPGDGARETVA
jgi:hypothetical protein